VLVDVLGPEITVYALLAVAFALLLTERIRNDVVAVLIVLALWASGLLEPKEALAGFASEPAIVVAAIFVLGAALHQTGVSDVLGRWIGRLAGTSYQRNVLVLMPAVAVLSAFTHHVTTTAVMVPVVLELARAHGVPASKLLMPVSFAASLGTAITIIGAPAFLIASAALQQAGEAGLGIFSIAPIGLAISALGTAFILVAGAFLLPERRGAEDPSARYRLDDYFTEVTVLPGSPLLEKSAQALEEDERYRLKVVGRVRDGRRMRAGFGEGELREGDVLLVRTSPEQILAVREESGVELSPVSQYQPGGEGSAPGGDEQEPGDRLVQAVVAPGSELVGRTLGDLDFRRRHGAIVLSLWRQDGWLRDELSRIALRSGDVLVLQGDDEALSRVAADRAFLMLVPFHGERRVRRKAPLAAAIMAGAVAAAAFGAPLEMAGLAGAAAAILAGCVTIGQAYRAIDQRIFVFIAGAIPLGTAMEKSGASAQIAAWLQDAVGGASAFWVLLGLFATVAVVTQFMSDSATTALFAPVAIALAQGLGHSPTAYVVTVAMAAVTSFLTPLGHHGNLLIYGPGGYRFSDFVRVGTPLTVLVAVAVALLAPALWGR
jgi:di/tricarboxylate transporter